MKNKNETMNIIEEKKPEYAEDAFKGVVPEISFSVNGTQVVIRVKAIVGAENYEVYQSETPRKKYSCVISDPSPVIDFYIPDGKSYYYKVRASHGIGNDKATTDYSVPLFIFISVE